MNVFQKILFHIIRLLRMTWFQVRYRVYPFKKIGAVLLPVHLSFGYGVLRFIHNGTYEKGEIDIIRQTLLPEDKVLELGTGLGFVSAYCAMIVGDNNVITYEANRLMEPYIRQLYRKNKVQPELRFALLGNARGSRTFYRYKRSFLASSLEAEGGRAVIAFEVPQEALNEVIRKIKPSYLVMDIEGGEYDLLNMISFQSIRKIQFELHPRVLGTERCETIFRILDTQGFRRNEHLSSGDNYYYYLPVS